MGNSWVIPFSSVGGKRKLLVELCTLCWELGGGCPWGEAVQTGRSCRELRLGREAVGQTDGSGSNGCGHSNQTDVPGRVRIAEEPENVAVKGHRVGVCEVGKPRELGSVPHSVFIWPFLRAGDGQSCPSGQIFINEILLKPSRILLLTYVFCGLHAVVAQLCRSQTTGPTKFRVFTLWHFLKEVCRWPR